MAVERISTGTTSAYTEGQELVMERIFDTPRELVWKAFTEADRVSR